MSHLKFGACRFRMTHVPFKIITNRPSAMRKTNVLLLAILLLVLEPPEGLASFSVFHPVGSILNNKDTGVDFHIPVIASDSIRPPALANCSEMPGRGYHIVQPGQTLYAIARAYEIPVQSLIGWNNIRNPDQIEVCQKIWLQMPGEYTGVPANQDRSLRPTMYSTTSLPVAKRQDVYWGNTAGRRETAINKVQDIRSVTGNVPVSYFESPVYERPNYNTPVPLSGGMTLPPPSDCAEKSGPGYHIVQSGETLTGIAKMYSLDEKELERINNIKPKDRLKKCMRLNIPAIVTHTQQESKKTSIYVLPPASPMPSIAGPADQDPLKPTPYLVQKAESLVSFAKKTKINPQDLALMNGLPIDAKLRPGQSLILPSVRNR